MSSDALIVRYHRAFNDRDFEVWREIFDPDVELLVDGMPFHGVDAAIAYGVGSTTQFPGLYIDSDRVVAESSDTIVAEAELVNGDRASGNFRRQGTVCEIWRLREGRVVSCRSYYMAEAAQEDAVRVPLRGEAARVAEERAALRRVAALVARGVSQDELFAAVTQELGWLVAADPTSLMRVEPDDSLRLVAAWSARNAEFPIGSTQAVDEALRTWLDAARPWRWGPDEELPASGPFVDEARALGIRTSVAVPIVVDGRVWGVLFASSTEDRPLAEDAEARIEGFSELVATAIANAESRAELVASRARLAATADETRRRIQRDVHDGAQQRLVQTVMTLKMAKAALDREPGPASDLVNEALRNAERASLDLRELVRGILPASLSRGGLRPGVESLVETIAVPVSVDIPAQRLPPALETTAYFVVAEALTNAVKHARAKASHVRVTIGGAALRIEVRDDGVGGATLEGGTGLVGLTDRVAAAGGELTITSPAGRGTTLVAELPIPPAS